MGRVFAAKHNKQIADHACLLVFAELNSVSLFESFKSHLDHADGTVYDLLTSSYDGLCLLTLKHSLCNFFRVRQMTDSCLNDFDTCTRVPFLQLTFKHPSHLLTATSERQ